MSVITTERISVFHIDTDVEFFFSDCAACGVIFAMPSTLENRRRQDGQSFYCPNGHSLVFGKNELVKARTKAKQLEEQLEASRSLARRERERREAAERSRAAHKAQATKLRRRAAHGVCPCCTRTFQDLARHIESKHPDFIEKAGEA